MTRVAVTGANGFVGRAVVAALRQRGLDVLAMVRSASPAGWANDAGISVETVDLARADHLADSLNGISTVIHAAASFGGDAAAHQRDTIDATQALLAAMTKPSRLVLISSLSVYDVAAMADHDTLSEQSPILSDASARDAYAAAKVAQERMVRATDHDVRILRPGAIYGPHRLWSDQLGIAKAGLILCPGGDAAVPAVHIDRVAEGVVAAATVDVFDGPINLIDPDPPSQSDWLAALKLRHLTLPRGMVLGLAGLVGRKPAWAARFRPLVYDTTRASALLAGTTLPEFATLLADLKSQEHAPT